MRTVPHPLMARLMVALVAVLVFLPWVRGYFLGDDWMLYARNSGRVLPEQLRLISDASMSAKYRPLFEVSLAWSWSLFAFNPIGHHIVNLGLHALNAVLVAALGQRLAQDRRVGLLAGLTFAVLGCHTEAVVWITARHEMIVSALALLSVISYIEFRDSGRRIWWLCAFLLYIIGFGFKETALALPFALVFYDFIFIFPSQQRDGRLRPTLGQIIPLVPLFVAGGAYLLFRLEVGGGYNVPFTLLGPPKNLVYYLLMETVGLPASTRFLSRFPAVTLSVIGSLAIACALGLWLARKQILRDRVVRFGCLWMVFALAPVILIVAERTTYVSSIGWALAAAGTMTLARDATSMSNLPSRRWLVVVVAAVFLGANLVTLSHRSYWWNQAAHISENVFSRVRSAMLNLPPEKDCQLWFFDMPYQIEYAYAFGNRVLFAAWLLQDQVGVRDVKVSVFQGDLVGASPEERMEQLYSEQAMESSVVAFFWQDGSLVQLSMPGKTGTP